MDWAALKTRITALAVTTWGWLGATIKLLTAFIGALLTLAAAVIATVWIVYFGQQLLPETSTSLPVEQSSAARAAHVSIQSWALQCVGAGSVRDLPVSLQQIFISPSFNGFVFLTQPSTSALKKIQPQVVSIIQLSSSMFGQRIELGRKASGSYTQLQYIQWLIILIGLVTTVVVSISSTNLFGGIDTVVGKSLRFLAIFLPALGTAVAAVNAFYNPRDDWNKAANALASIAQLHGQIAVGIWSVDCPGDDDKSRTGLTAKLEDWTKRYNDIITISDTHSSGTEPQQAPQGVPPGSPVSTPPTQPGMPTTASENK